ncbi:MAG: N-acetyltransferase family protein [Paracoccaceae bacterium]
MTEVEIRRLDVDDLELWKAIRQAALETAPRAFGRTLAGHLALSDAEHARRLTCNVILAAFVAGEIVGSVGWRAIDLVTESHRGKINSVFVQPEFQGRGVSDALMRALLGDATGAVLQLELAVTVGQDRAIAFYRRHGFEIFATIPRALCHDGEFFDEHLMLRYLDA